MATRQSGEITRRFIVNCPIKPRRKHPDKFARHPGGRNGQACQWRQRSQSMQYAMLLQSAARLGAPENTLRPTKQKTPGAARLPGVISPGKNRRAVVANSIAAYLNSKESVSRVPRSCNESSFTSSEMKTIAKLSGELTGIVPVRPAKRIRTVEQVARIADVLRRE